MGRIRHSRARECYGLKAQVKSGIGRDEDRIGRADEMDATGHDVLDGGLSLDHTVVAGPVFPSPLSLTPWAWRRLNSALIVHQTTRSA
jgi:hypothetical protein